MADASMIVNCSTHKDHRDTFSSIQTAIDHFIGDGVETQGVRPMQPFSEPMEI